MNVVPITGEGAGYMISAHREKLLAKPDDCGIDLFPYAKTEKDIMWTELGFYNICSVPTGVRLLIPPDHFALITGRSSSPDKLMGCIVLPGVIDHGYTGEYRIRVQVPVVDVHLCRQFQLTRSILKYSDDKVAIAQAIIIPYMRPVFDLRDSLPDTGRGSQGFGSTDKIEVHSKPDSVWVPADTLNDEMHRERSNDEQYAMWLAAGYNQ